MKHIKLIKRFTYFPIPFKFMEKENKIFYSRGPILIDSVWLPWNTLRKVFEIINLNDNYKANYFLLMKPKRLIKENGTDDLEFN